MIFFIKKRPTFVSDLHQNTTIMLTITDLAANRIKELRSKEGLTEEFNIRVAVEAVSYTHLTLPTNREV